MNDIIVQNDIQEELDFTYEILMPEVDSFESGIVGGGPKLLESPDELAEPILILETKFDKSVTESDKLDYLVAASSGVLTAAMDIFWVGEFSLKDARTWGPEHTNKFVIAISKSK